MIVTNTNDSGAGSLRQALIDVAPGETITFSITGTITLTTGALSIAQDQTITGPGISSLTIDGNAADRIFTITGGVIAISGMTLTNGSTVEYGGAIRNEGTLTLTNISFTSNAAFGSAAGGGGAIWNSSTVTLTGCTFDSNQIGGANGHGGAFFNSGTATLTSCTFTNNSANNEGGAIFNDAGGTFTFSLGLISDNACTGATGGGVSNRGTFSITDSTISDNTATNPGSAFYANNGTTTITRCTINGHAGRAIENSLASFYVLNSTLSDNEIAIHNTGSATEIRNSTITNNVTGISSSNGSSWTVYDSIFCGNSTLDVDSQTSDLFSLGHNIFGTTFNPITVAAGDQSDVTPAAVALGPLANNGGPTFTHALLLGSVAINSGDNTDAPATDQRGEPRIVGGTIDIGSFEVQSIQCLIWTGGALPAWLTIDGNCFVVAANFFKGATKAEANAIAQSNLDSFVNAAVENGTLVCAAFGNQTVYFDVDCEGGVLTYDGTLPDWITIDTDNSRLVGAANQYFGPTQDGANTLAQNALNAFGNAAISDETLTCVTGWMGCVESFVPRYRITGYVDGQFTMCEFQDPSAAPVWDGSFYAHQIFSPESCRFYNSNEQSVNGFQSVAFGLEINNGTPGEWHMVLRTHDPGGNNIFWAGTLVGESPVGVYNRTDGCDETTLTVTVEEYTP